MKIWRQRQIAPKAERCKTVYMQVGGERCQQILCKRAHCLSSALTLVKAFEAMLLPVISSDAKLKIRCNLKQNLAWKFL